MAKERIKISGAKAGLFGSHTVITLPTLLCYPNTAYVRCSFLASRHIQFNTDHRGTRQRTRTRTVQLTLARIDRPIIGLSETQLFPRISRFTDQVEPLMLFPRNHRRNMDIESRVEGQQLHSSRAVPSGAPQPSTKSPPLVSTAKERKIATLPRIRMQSSSRHGIFEPWADDEEEEERARQYIIEKMSDWFLDDGEEFRGRLEKVRRASLHTLSSSYLFVCVPSPFRYALGSHLPLIRHPSTTRRHAPLLKVHLNCTPLHRPRHWTLPPRLL